MATYVDELRTWRDRRVNFDSCHLLADSDEELECFAASIGVPAYWKHNDHYDLSPSVRAKAVKAGAIETTAYHLAALRITLRNRV